MRDTDFLRQILGDCDLVDHDAGRLQAEDEAYGDRSRWHQQLGDDRPDALDNR
jgi:hypothetical protein